MICNWVFIYSCGHSLNNFNRLIKWQKLPNRLNRITTNIHSDSNQRCDLSIWINVSIYISSCKVFHNHATSPIKLLHSQDNCNKSLSEWNWLPSKTSSHVFFFKIQTHIHSYHDDDIVCVHIFHSNSHKFRLFGFFFGFKWFVFVSIERKRNAA